jgi:hypothetical protein
VSGFSLLQLADLLAMEVMLELAEEEVLCLAWTRSAIFIQAGPKPTILSRS